MRNIIEIENEIQIGDKILEKGDKIRVISEKVQDPEEEKEWEKVNDLRKKAEHLMFSFWNSNTPTKLGFEKTKALYKKIIDLF